MLVVLAVQLKLEAAQSVDLVNGNLCRAGNAGAVNGSAAGQGAGHTNLHRAGIGGGSTNKHGGSHCKGQNRSK